VLSAVWRRMRRVSLSSGSLDDLLIAGSYNSKKVREINEPEVAISQIRSSV
jgi:hypothetical protein